MYPYDVVVGKGRKLNTLSSGFISLGVHFWFGRCISYFLRNYSWNCFYCFFFNAEIETEGNLKCLSAYNNQDWARARLGARNSIWLSHVGDKSLSTWAVISRSWDQRPNLYLNPGTSEPEHLKQNPNYCAKCPLPPIALSRNVYASCLFEKQLRWFTFQMSRRGRDELGGWQVPRCLNYHLLSPRAGISKKMKSWGKPGLVCQLLCRIPLPCPTVSTRIAFLCMNSPAF